MGKGHGGGRESGRGGGEQNIDEMREEMERREVGEVGGRGEAEREGDERRI